jgi:hypothetical protein
VKGKAAVRSRTGGAGGKMRSISRWYI